MDAGNALAPIVPFELEELGAAAATDGGKRVMKNFVQPGESVEFTAPAGGVVSGRPVQIGQLLVVAAVTAAAGERFNGLTEGVITYTKIGTQAWAEGAIVYWDSNPGQFTTVAATNFRAGVATEAVGAGAGETSGTVRLDGVGRVQEL